MLSELIFGKLATFEAQLTEVSGVEIVKVSMCTVVDTNQKEASRGFVEQAVFLSPELSDRFIAWKRADIGESINLDGFYSGMAYEARADKKSVNGVEKWEIFERPIQGWKADKVATVYDRQDALSFVSHLNDTPFFQKYTRDPSLVSAT